MSELEEKVALVTGGGSGIGKAAGELLARHGARVALLDAHEQPAREAAAGIEREGGQAMALVADISEPKAMQQAIAAIEERWGRLDIVFANAGINGVWAPIDELTADEFDHTLAVNLRGTFLTIQQSVRLLKRRGGSVIITSSVNGTRIFSNPGATAYSVSKAGQVAMAKMLARELAQDRIRVNVICPGAVQTNIGSSTEQRHTERISPKVEFPEGEMPLTRGRPGRPEQVAQLVLFLASEASSLITGTEVWIDGAESLLRG